MMIEVGLRVCRGPDWKWGNQDDGEGHIGTVVEIGKAGSTASPDKTVVVHWDCGTRTNYRVGYQNAYDLLIFDNAPTGVMHPNIICDECKKHGIRGMRWKCTECYDFDLCSECYMNGKHDLNHVFLRLMTQNSVGVKMPKRQNSTRIQAWGIFPGARVVRGPDWDWASQDGGEGKTGKVTDIRGWDMESGRSVASILWSTNSTNVYRLGHKGKVDLKYTQDAPGSYYYKEHLPKLGEPVETNPTVNSQQGTHNFSVGDKVKVILEVDVLKQIQEGHGGWNPKMAEYIGKTGVVHRVTDRGDIRVQYTNGMSSSGTRWTFHPGALTKIEVLAINDMVQVLNDLDRVKKLQAGHGEWTDGMMTTLGKTGQVTKVYPDSDLRVLISNQSWTFNPACVRRVSSTTAPDSNNTMATSGREANEQQPLTGLASLLDTLLTLQPNSDSPDRIVSESAQGNLPKVKELLAKYPSKVDIKSSGKTALQVASHQGHLEVVKTLLAAKANLEVPDQDGDTALHYSIFGDKSDVTKLLLSKGAKVNAVNKGGCTGLHVAVNKSHLRCVRVLLNFNCNVNSQDTYGDTALHDGIAKENCDIIELLIEAPGAEFTLKNKRGFNVLHHAALKGNNFATSKLLVKSRQLVDVRKDDGFSALHLSSLNGHKNVAETLITKGQCEIDIRNNRQQTPLLLAVSQGHTSLIELLVSRGASVNAEDEDGDTCLHLALMRQTVSTATESSSAVAKIRSSLGMEDTDANRGAAIACYLAQAGASLTFKNHQDKTPLDIISDPQVADLVQQYADSYKSRTKPPQRPIPAQPPLLLSQSDLMEDGGQRSHSAPSVVSTSNVPASETACRICRKPPNCRFDPCGHVAVCMECGPLFSKCMLCKIDIKNRMQIEAHASSLGNRQISKEEEVRNLKEKMRELEEAQYCSICMENRKNIVFLCGHGTCKKCAKTLKHCPMCRKPITKKINLFT